LLVALAHSFAFRHHLTDDAFISFRYLANFLAGDGLVYNPGEPVWGFSNFLWIAMLAPWVALGAEPLTTARLIGVASNLLLIGALLLGLPSSGERRRNAAGAALLATNGAFLMQGMSGLETSFFSLLLLAALALHARAGRHGGLALCIAPGLVTGLATLTRPEGAFLFAILVGDAVLERRRSRTPLVDRLGGLLLGAVPLVAAFETSMFFAYDALWPNSIDSKVGLSAEQLRRGLHYAAVFARNYPVALLVPFVAGLRWRAAGPDERLLLRTTVVFASYPVVVGGDWMPGYRLFQPLLVLGAALTPLALSALGNRLGAPLRGRVAAALVTCCCLLGAASSLRDPHVNIGTRPTLVEAAIRVGVWMRENLPADSLLATSTAGTIPFYSGLQVVDMMGINDRVIAARRDLPAGWRGIEKGDGRYVLSRRPNYIQLGSFLGSSVPLFLSDIELFADEAFHRQYERLEISVDPDTELVLYRRRRRLREPLDPAERARIQRIAARQLKLSTYRY
jgi:hypothetical protein